MQTFAIGARDKSQLLSKWRDDRDMLYDRGVPSPIQGDLYMLVPKGRKCCLWFTGFSTGPACFIVELDRAGWPTNIVQVACSFERELAFDTLVSGVLVDDHCDGVVFCALLMQIWKGRPMPRALDKQIVAFERLMGAVHHDPELPLLAIALPAMCDDQTKVKQLVANSQVGVHGVRVADTARNAFLGVYRVTEEDQPSCVVVVKPEIEEDVYSLWSGEKIGHALVPDLKTSVMLNGLFRNIKENSNLDALEESDDEDEFEDISEDRFLVAKEGFPMEVKYSVRFKGWIPIKRVDVPPTHIARLREIESHGKDSGNRRISDLVRQRQQGQGQQGQHRPGQYQHRQGQGQQGQHGQGQQGQHRQGQQGRRPFKRNQPSKRVRGYLGF